MKQPKRRKRRTPEAARDEILDAASERLLEAGPAGIRLQDVAKDVGISHPAILHHFGNREGLIQSVLDRAIRGLEEDLVGALGAASGPVPDPRALLGRVAETLGSKGQGKLLAWLMLSGHDPFDSEVARTNWAKIARAAHASRTQFLGPGRNPAYEDTLFVVLLSALALFAQAITGEALFKIAGLESDKDAPRRFQEWFAALLLEHLAAR